MRVSCFCELLAFEDFAFASDFADIETSAQELRERAARKWYAANTLAGLEYTELGNNAPLAQTGHQEVVAAEPGGFADDR